MSGDRVEATREAVASALADLEDFFLPRCRLTFLMRDPENDECTMLITNDPDLPAVRRVIEGLEGRETT